MCGYRGFHHSKSEQQLAAQRAPCAPPKHLHAYDERHVTVGPERRLWGMDLLTSFQRLKPLEARSIQTG